VLTCPTCGQQNSDGARFCGACGAGLAAGPAREVRKTVTVIFADLTGSTALGEELDPESLRHVTGRYFDEMRTVLERPGGTGEKFIGDAVMAVFGVPQLHEDDALRALRAAAEMRERLGFLNEGLEREFGVRLQARIGVNTGEVVAGDGGSGQRLATGDAVNVAARLEQAAQPGEILLGDETHRLASAAIEVEPVKALELKGKAEPVLAFRLRAVVPGAPGFERHLDAPLVGRRGELACVRAAFDAAVTEQRCRLVTVFGPPGIGKSRLARELAAALADDATVLSGNCLSYGEGITYWPLREIFVAAGLEHVLDEAVALGKPEETFWSVRKALEAFARERALVLVVEDIHWAEPTLLDLLEHLVDWTREAPLLLLCLSRPDLLDDRPTWATGRPNVETLALEPLSERDADEFVGTLMEGDSLDPGARARVLAVAEGNPLFLEQLLATFAEGGDARHVPPTIQALLAARVDALAAEERDVLERAAVSGFEFEWEALGHLALAAGRPSGATLAALVRKELILPHETTPDWFRFRHALIRDAAYEAIPKELRAELHERAARWLEGKQGELEALIGHHLEQAVRFRRELRLGDKRTDALAEEAGTYLANAGRRAHTRFDVPASVNLIERALALLPESAARVDLLLRLAHTIELRGDLSRSEELIRQADAEAKACGDAAVEWRARLALAFLGDGDPDERLALALQAVAALEQAGDELGLFHALRSAGIAGLAGGRLGPTADAFERALRLARQLGEWQYETDVIAGFCVSMICGPTPVPDAIARVERQLAEGRRNLSVEAPGHVFLGLLYALDGRPDEGRRVYEHGQQVAEELTGLDLPMAWSRGAVGARIELLAGEPEAAEREVRAAAAAHSAMGERRSRAEFTLRLAEALWAQGRVDEGVAAALEVEQIEQPDLDQQGRWRFVRAQALARMGELHEAERLAREAVDLLEPSDLLWDRADARMALAEVLRRAGCEDEAERVLRDAIELYEQKGHVIGARRARAAASIGAADPYVRGAAPQAREPGEPLVALMLAGLEGKAAQTRPRGRKAAGFERDTLGGTKRGIFEPLCK
jgi:class 3 adenylate cyclase/tetratricopeptide (TPR) repeat protein